MTFEQQLRIPGPTPLPERVIRSASRPMINHRGPEFKELLAEITGGVQRALGTTNDILFFPASGSGGLEAAVVNMLGPGERALFCSMGSFGQRWIEIARTYGVDVVTVISEPGQSTDLSEMDRILSADDSIATVFVTHNETSTGVTNDIAGIAQLVKRHGRQLCLDSVSGAPSIPVDMDELGIDVVVVGSQKGWMAPPGLTMIAVSEAAMARASLPGLPRWYLDFNRELKQQQAGQTATTPALQVMFALQEGLRMLNEEGQEACQARHRRVAERIRAGLEAMDLRILADPAVRSDTVTAVHNPTAGPEELREFLAHLRTEYGLVLAGGQGELKGHIFRVGHLGYIDDGDAYSVLDSIERGLAAIGVRPVDARPLAAAQNAGDLRVPVFAS